MPQRCGTPISYQDVEQQDDSAQRLFDDGASANHISPDMSLCCICTFCPNGLRIDGGGCCNKRTLSGRFVV
jgi:hypothetical protein